MLKYLAALVFLIPTNVQALTVAEGCQVLASQVAVMAMAKDYGMSYDTANEWVADMPFVEPWSKLLAITVDTMYKEKMNITPEDMGLSTFIACVEILSGQ